MHFLFRGTADNGTLNVFFLKSFLGERWANFFFSFHASSNSHDGRQASAGRRGGGEEEKVYILSANTGHSTPSKKKNDKRGRSFEPAFSTFS